MLSFMFGWQLENPKCLGKEHFSTKLLSEQNPYMASGFSTQLRLLKRPEYCFCVSEPLLKPAIGTEKFE